MPRKINAGQVVLDLKRGMHDTEIMAKYDLSPGQLQSLYNKLTAAGLWKREEPTPTKPVEESKEDTRFVCPSCGMPQYKPFEECPQCGVIVSKLTPQAEPEPHSAEAGSPTDSARLRHGTVDATPGSRVLLVSCVAAALLLVAVALAYFFRPTGPTPIGQNAADNAQHPSRPGQSTTATQGVKEPMKYIKNLPRVREINPAVDAEIHRSFKDVDKSLSKGRDRLDRVMKEE